MWKFSTRYSVRSLSPSFPPLTPPLCHAVFTCCRCLRITTNNFVENFVSHFSTSSAHFLMCPFCISDLFLGFLFFLPVTLFGFYHVVGNYALCEIQRTQTFGLQHHRLSVLVVMRYAQWVRGGGVQQANKLPKLRQQQVDLTSLPRHPSSVTKKELSWADQVTGRWGLCRLLLRNPASLLDNMSY